MRKAIESGRENGTSLSSGLSGTRRELMRLPNDYVPQTGLTNHRIANDNDDFISSESDRQQLLIRYCFCCVCSCRDQFYYVFITCDGHEKYIYNLT